MGIIQDLQKDVASVTNVINKQWVKQHVENLKDKYCRVDGFGFLQDLHVADYIWTEEEFKSHRELLGQRGFDWALDVPKKLHVIADALDRKHMEMNVTVETLATQCMEAIKDSLESLPWKELEEVECAGMKFIPKKFRTRCRVSLGEAGATYNEILEHLANDLERVAADAPPDAEVGRSVSRMYRKWGIKQLGELWRTWENKFKSLLNAVKTKPTEKQTVDKEPDAEEE